MGQHKHHAMSNTNTDDLSRPKDLGACAYRIYQRSLTVLSPLSAICAHNSQTPQKLQGTSDKAETISALQRAPTFKPSALQRAPDSKKHIQFSSTKQPQRALQCVPTTPTDPATLQGTLADTIKAQQGSYTRSDAPLQPEHPEETKAEQINRATSGWYALLHVLHVL